MFVPTHIHTDYSILDGHVKLDKLTERLLEYGYPACTITDHGSISGVVAFSEALRKKNIKPIIGCELYVTDGDATVKDKDDRKLQHMVCLAKNKQGFYDLCKIVSRSNDDDVYYYKPRLDINILGELATPNLIWLTGHPGSLLFQSINDAQTDDEAVRNGIFCINRLKNKLGNDIFIEIQRICYFDDRINNILVKVAKETNTKEIACIDAHYVDRSDAENQRLLLAASLSTTMVKWKKDLADSNMSSFFLRDYYHVPSYKELEQVHTTDELKNNLLLNDLCEDYSLKNQPSLPKFDCPNHQDESAYLKYLCQQGWYDILERRNVVNSIYDKNLYAERILNELEVISEYNLDGYFLIVQDFVKWARKQEFCAIGRGSCAGSLAAYLLGISLIDPIPNDLLFTRFLNKGRFTADNIEYPDIDVDFPGEFRESVLNYVKDKYGNNHVGKVATFGTLHGAGAIKEVLRMYDAASFTEMNEITRNIPQESDISDQMSDQKESSILRFTLNNMPNLLEEYCTIDKNGDLHGKYSQYFKQAIEIEGSVKSQGVHAAGVIIAPQNLNEVCPMIRSKDGEKMCGIEMNGLKTMGFIKFDFLSVNTYSKLNNVNRLLKGEECIV